MRPVGNAGVNMNKGELIDAISGRLGDRRSATEAVNAVLETIQSTVANGDKVAIIGFGVFEKSERQARTGRNPATGAAIQVPAASVPRFRPGAGFKALVNAGNKAQAARVDGTKASAKADRTMASAKEASEKKADAKKASGKKADGKKASGKKAGRKKASK
jgi:DNA-binding protein HU-beta